ncbi:helix-turn-helix domain-containing transcriptional regulator [Dysgonomonas sp.]
MINIDDILKKKKITKTDVSKRMGLSRESLYRILSGNPTLDNLTKLAAALNVPISDLFDTPTDNTVNCPYCGNKIKLTKDGANTTPGVKPRPVTVPTPTPTAKAPEQSPAKDETPEPDVAP